MTKMELTRALVVEGRYDAARLANLVEGTILTTDGFAIFKDRQMQALFKKIARAQGMILLTDSDAAGFKIRHFVADLVGQTYVLHAFVPAIAGKEPRKEAPGKEGLLGVEGIPDDLILQALRTALDGQGDRQNAHESSAPTIAYSDLYDWGLTGGPNSGERRRAFLQYLGLPPRLSKKELLQVLNTLYHYDDLLEKWEQFCAR